MRRARCKRVDRYSFKVAYCIRAMLTTHKLILVKVVFKRLTFVKQPMDLQPCPLLFLYNGSKSPSNFSLIEFSVVRVLLVNFLNRDYLIRRRTIT
jgi:hypothetical protein